MSTVDWKTTRNGIVMRLLWFLGFDLILLVLIVVTYAA